MSSSSRTFSRICAPSVELLEGAAAQQHVSTMAAMAKRQRQLVMQRARSKRHYDKKKIERIMW